MSTPQPSPALLADLLRDQLLPIERRTRRLRRLRVAAGVGAAAALLALVLTWWQERQGFDPAWPWVTLVLAAVAAYVYIERRAAPADHHQLARQIERANPELRALLLTALGQRAADGRLGYMQEMVLREALARATPEAWGRAVPPRTMTLTAIGAGLAGGSLALLTLAALFPGWPTLLPDAYGLTVAPGDTDLERGNTLLVTARFGRKLPSRVTLVVRVPGRPTTRVEMTKNLGDPVFGSVTPAIAADRASYQLEYDGHRSGRFRVTTFEHPDLERIDARVEMPRHAGAPAREIRDVRHLAVTQGARVTLTFHLNKRVRQAQLESAGTPPLALRARGNRVQVVTFTPERTRRWELHLVDEEGRRNRVPPRLSIEVQANEPPRLTMAFPGRDVRVSPLEEVTVEAKLSDDLGLLGWGVSYGISGKQAREVRLGSGAGKSVETARHLIPVEELGAKPDDLLTYHFWAEDLDGDGKRRRTAGDLYFAEVRPFEERFREAPDQGGQEGGGGAGERGPTDDLLKKQKDIVNATWRLDREVRAGNEIAEIRKDLGVVAKSQSEQIEAAAAPPDGPRPAPVQAALDDAVGSMGRAGEALKTAQTQQPRPDLTKAVEATQAAYAALLRLKDRESQVTRGRGGGGGGGGGADQRALAGLELKSKESRYETRREATGDSEGDPAKREDRVVAGRLQELARRQKAMSERLKELQAALRELEQKDPEEAERQLKRLREEQQQLLGELDELLARTQTPENRQRLAETREALEQTRGEAQSAAEALAKGETSRALGASTRAERGLDEARGGLQKQVAEAFGQDMRALGDEAKRLDETQRRLGEALARAAGGPTDSKTDSETDPKMEAPVANPTEARRLGEALERQQKDVGRLLERMQQVTEKAEGTAPLLSRKLYDTYRRAKTEAVDEALGRAGELAGRNLPQEAAALEAQARLGVGELRRGVEEAAKGVLGDEAEALRLARSELEALVAEARQEPSVAAGQAGGPPLDRGRTQGPAGRQPGETQHDERQPGETRPGQQPGGTRAQAGEAPGQQPGAAPQAGSGQAPGAEGQRPGEGQATGAGQQPGGSGRRAQAAGSGSEGGQRDGNAAVGPGGGNEGPITGEGFRAFDQRLRDLEDLVGDPRLRQDVSRVRERARSLRADWRRHSRAPAGAVLEEQIVRPLIELRDRIAEDLRRLDPQDKLAPVDRDPVPGRYGEMVRRYYESLGKGK